MNVEKQIWSMAQAIQKIFCRDFVRKTAKDVGFLKRFSKLKPEVFLSLCTLLKDSVGNESLEHLCSAISYQFKTSISKQALHDRFNDKAVSFLKQIYQDLTAIQEEISSPLYLNQLFSRIRIMDSTSFRLPSDYPDYPGSQGSGVNIQLEYDWIQGEFLNNSVHPETKSDREAAHDMIDSLVPGDLLLRDLGYYAASIMRQIDKKGAFFISRAPANTKFWSGSSKKGWIQIKPEEDLEEKDPGETIDYGFVRVGGDKRHSFEARLVGQKLTPEQRKKREQSLQTKRQKGRHTQSAEQRNDIQILVTNITQETLDPQDLYPIYSIRWQVEILFKTWKSLFEINEIRSMKQERFECHLYGTLISILLSSMMMFQCRYYLYQQYQTEASEYKCMDLVKEALPHLASSVQSNIKAVFEVIERIYENARRHGRKDHRKSHDSPFDVLDLPYK